MGRIGEQGPLLMLIQNGTVITYDGRVRKGAPAVALL